MQHQRQKQPFPSFPSTALARQWETAGRHWVAGKGRQDPHGGKGRRQGTDTAKDGVSAGCGLGLTLPFGLLHAAVSPRMAASPSLPLGGGLGCSLLHALQSPFLEPFHIVWRCYRWETTALDGEVPLSQRREGLLLGLQQVLGLQQFPFFLPQPYLNTSGAPEPSPLLHLSLFLPLALQQHLQMLSRSTGVGASPLSEVTYKRVPVSPSPLALQSTAGAEFLLPLQISSNWCRRGWEVPCHGTTFMARAAVIRQRGQRPGDRDLQLLQRGGAPLLASNPAGCSVGSLRVAGLITGYISVGKRANGPAWGPQRHAVRGIRDTALQQAERQEFVRDLTDSISPTCYSIFLGQRLWGCQNLNCDGT